MPIDISQWTRIEHGGMPIYVRGDKPDWFVPNDAGDVVLRALLEGAEPPYIAGKRFIARLPCDTPWPAPSRRELVDDPKLRELWLHVTDRCNLACDHCLFACSPDERAELSVERALELGREARTLGCRVFALTGGEPLLHPGIDRIVKGLLALGDVHVALLTNGSLLADHRHLVEQWDWSRCHLQVSLDGLEKGHDSIRGQGSFSNLVASLRQIGEAGIPFTVSMVPDARNVDDMPAVVDLAAELGASNVHFMWYFVMGRGETNAFVSVDRLTDRLLAAAERGEQVGVGVDTIDALRTQVFAPPGTRHDGPVSGVESVAVGVDGHTLYPSPALIGREGYGVAMPQNGDGLADAFRDGALFRRFREASAERLESPFKYILGGGDPDHSIVKTGELVGGDPYWPLYETTAKWLICREASRQTADGPPRLRLRMGDILHSCGAHGSLALVHGNCLQSLASVDARDVVKAFYTEAATTPTEEIENPVCYPEKLVSHIPRAHRVRGYGCGSPVLDADLRAGESVVDLGAGRGVECFIAASLVGAGGGVVGVDMLEPMLALARDAAPLVADTLGFDVVRFEKGYLEALPLDDESADVMLSNCVLNLSPNKRKTFAEALRVLRPGGRLVVSDVVCEEEPHASIRNDDTLKGECIAGALTQRDLFGILDETGFVGVRIIKRFPYRVVGDHPFFSLTFEARRPEVDRPSSRAMFLGPGTALVLEDGTYLWPGQPRDISSGAHVGYESALFSLDEAGAVTNVDLGESACCTGPSCCTETEPTLIELPLLGGRCDCATIDTASTRQRSGCMVCGGELVYSALPESSRCSYCGAAHQSEAVCENGHFVCDDCHRRDGLEVVHEVCLSTIETDMIALLRVLRSHVAIPVHGPEHHAMVPGIIVATARNLGNVVTDEMIQTAIARGAAIPGGQCGVMGVCGAAAGVGAAFGVLLESTPLEPTKRQTLHRVVGSVLDRIADFEAARCCQRESWIALREAARLSKDLLKVPLLAEAELRCTQSRENKECIKRDCPIFPRRDRSRER